MFYAKETEVIDHLFYFCEPEKYKTWDKFEIEKFREYVYNNFTQISTMRLTLKPLPVFLIQEDFVSLCFIFYYGYYYLRSSLRSQIHNLKKSKEKKERKETKEK